MKYISTLIFALLVIGGVTSSFSQISSLQPPSSWFAPKFDKSFISRNGIKTIHIRSYSSSQAPVDRYLSGCTYEYDVKGNLVQLVEIQAKDTSRVHDFIYTENGKLGWKKLTDKVWDKEYKSGIRLNKSKEVYQVKSYEMLENDEVMLLETRQYIYNSDSMLIGIKFLENNQLIKTHKYEYNKDGRVAKEIFENRSGSEIKSVSYKYNERGQTTYMAISTGKEEDAVPIKQEYMYAYDKNGQQSEVKWLKNEVLQGTVNYIYDDNGMLTQMHRVMNPESSGSANFFQMVRYEKYE